MTDGTEAEAEERVVSGPVVGEIAVYPGEELRVAMMADTTAGITRVAGDDAAGRYVLVKESNVPPDQMPDEKRSENQL